MPFPFEANMQQLRENIEYFVDETFSSLVSEFMVMPRGDGFVDYGTFERGYEALKKATGSFTSFNPDVVFQCIHSVPISFVVLRAMLGFTPSEWAYAATERTDINIGENPARSLDRKVRFAPLTPFGSLGRVTEQRMAALVRAACALLEEGAPPTAPEMVHRLDKADTREGIRSIRGLADFGVPYAMLLYERFLGRPFAGHRDSVSGLVGDVLESAIEGILHEAGISARKTKRAERILSFDQAPDFIIPDEFSPYLVIEAKIAEDAGTARDKVARILRLVNMSRRRERPYQVVACLAGRGFAQRREDMRQLLIATEGKVFTLRNLDQLVDHTLAREFRTR